MTKFKAGDIVRLRADYLMNKGDCVLLNHGVIAGVNYKVSRTDGKMIYLANVKGGLVVERFELAPPPSVEARGFHRFIDDPGVTAHKNNQSTQIVVATINRDSYMNVFVSGANTLSVTAAKQLRDALIEAYPLPTAAPVAQFEKPAPAAARMRPKGKQEYRGNGKHDWELVTPGGLSNTARLRVPGGWLYRYGGAAPAFVPLSEVIGYDI